MDTLSILSTVLEPTTIKPKRSKQNVEVFSLPDRPRLDNEEIKRVAKALGAKRWKRIEHDDDTCTLVVTVS